MQNNMTEARKRLNLLEEKGKTLALQQVIDSLKGEVDHVETELRLRSAALAEVENLDQEFSVWASARMEVINLVSMEMARKKAICMENAKNSIAAVLGTLSGVALSYQSHCLYGLGEKHFGALLLIVGMSLLAGAVNSLLSKQD